MVVCKFFLQGYCKFGDSCKFDHQLNDYNAQKSTSILRQPHFAPSQHSQPPLAVKLPIQEKQIDQNTLLQAVVNDMIGAEKGGQWLLSSYAPFKNKVAFPGFEDHSFEEIRWGYYEARKNGTLDQFKHQVQMMFQDAVLKAKALQSPSQELVIMINNVYNAPSSTPQLPSTQVFDHSSAPTIEPVSTNMFGKTSQNIFGNAPTPQNFSQNNIFGGGTTTNAGQAGVFGGQQSNIFSQAAANITKPSGSIFGSPQSPQKGSVFGGSSFNQLSPNTTTFGQSPLVQPSLFSNTSPPSQQQNIFGGMQQHFGAVHSQTTNVFQTMASQHRTNLFQTTPNQIQTGSFPQPQTTVNVFQTTQNPVQPSVFGGGGFSQQSSFGQTAPTPTSVFGQQATNAQTHTASIFGGSTSKFPQVIQQPLQNNDQDLYSKVEDLSEEEIKFFESDDWDLKKISEKPPCYQMCFQ